MRDLAGPHPVDLAALSGTWHVVRTTLPFWERRRDPRITYRVLPGGRLDDLVEHASGRVHGIDTQDAEVPRLFHWRGTGLVTRWLTSDWYLLAHDEAYARWAVTFFGATRFTPEGMDVYARGPELAEATVAAALEPLRHHPTVAGLVPRLFTPRR